LPTPSLVCRYKLESVAEYSEPRLDPVRPVLEKLVAQAVPAAAARQLEGRVVAAGLRLVLPRLGQRVVVQGLGEGWPGGAVLVLGLAREQLVATLAAHVDTWGEVVSVHFTGGPRAEGHDESEESQGVNPTLLLSPFPS